MVVIARGPAAATYDPAGDRWTDVPTPPLTGTRLDAVWTGSEVILWGGAYAGRTDGAVADRGWRWTPGGAGWEPLPDLPAGSRTSLGSIAWTGTDIVVWGMSSADPAAGVGARWRPGDVDWRGIRSSPQGRIEAFDGTPGSQAMVSLPTRGQVAVRALEGDEHVRRAAAPPLFVYDPPTDDWTMTDVAVAGFDPPLVASGDTLLQPNPTAPIAGTLPSS
jgi:hypothetical protein